MKRLAVIIPVKSAARKSRLSGLLDRKEREEFARLLLEDVLGSLAGAGLLGRTYVVSPDTRMLALAARAGAVAVRERDDAGVNSAVSLGLGFTGDASSVLVIPADLPLLKPSDLLGLEVRSQGMDVGIAPSRAFDGTNALVFAKPLRFPLSYDNDSFWNHLSGAARGGLSVGVCTERGLAFDVDSPEDFAALAGSRSKRPSAVFARRALR